jgi:hypothetical protein
MQPGDLSETSSSPALARSGDRNRDCAPFLGFDLHAAVCIDFLHDLGKLADGFVIVEAVGLVMLERVRYRTSRRNWIATGDAPGKTCVKKSSLSVSS